jgi:hypothetical protein
MQGKRLSCTAEGELKSSERALPCLYLESLPVVALDAGGGELVAGVWAVLSG